MTKHYRPDGWENPFNPAAFYHHKDFEVHDAFEAGVDAILEALAQQVRVSPLRFATVKEAIAFGNRIFEPTKTVESWEVEEVEEPPNYTFKKGKLVNVG